MNGIRFENAFEPVPPIVHTRIQQTLKEVKTVKQAKPITAFVLAAVILMALAGAAYAAVQSGVLDFVFHSGARSQEQLDLVQSLGIIHKADGITTTVTDAMMNGRKLSVAFAFETEKPFYIITDSITVNGVEITVNDSNMVNMWYGNEYAMEHAGRTRGFSGTLDGEAVGVTREALDTALKRLAEDGVADVRVHLTFLVPEQKLRPIEGAYDEDSRGAWRAIDACVAAGDTPVDKESGYVWVDSAWLGDDFFEWISAAQVPVGDARAHIEHSNMRALDSFELAFTLDAGADGKTDRTPKEGANDGRTRIAFNEISFTPLCSTFDFTIAPDWMTMEEIESTFRYFAFYGIDENQNRTLLDFQDMFYEGGCGPEEQPDGSLALHVRYQMPALTELPPVIAIVPYNGDSSAEEPLWAYAIYV